MSKNLHNQRSILEENQSLKSELETIRELLKKYQTEVETLKVENANYIKKLAHDISNPLQIISMTIESLMDSPPQDLSLTLARVKRSSDLIVEIVHSMRHNPADKDVTIAKAI